jgi:hypothetical protein
MCKVQGPSLAVRGLLWCTVLTWARAAWLRRLARCVIGGVPVSWAVEVGVGVEGWAFRNEKLKAGILNVDLGSEFGASRGRCVGPFPSLTRDPTLTGVTTCVNLTGGRVSGEDNKKGVSSGNALANADAEALMSGGVGSFQDMEPFAPALMATMVSTKNSAPVGVRDKYL